MKMEQPVALLQGNESNEASNDEVIELVREDAINASSTKSLTLFKSELNIKLNARLPSSRYRMALQHYEQYIQMYNIAFIALSILMVPDFFILIMYGAGVSNEGRRSNDPVRQKAGDSMMISGGILFIVGMMLISGKMYFEGKSVERFGGFWLSVVDGHFMHLKNEIDSITEREYSSKSFRGDTYREYLNETFTKKHNQLFFNQINNMKKRINEHDPELSSGQAGVNLV